VTWTTARRAVFFESMRLKSCFVFAVGACGLVVVVVACGAGFDGLGSGCTRPAPGTHAVLGNGVSCTIECSPGYFDCDDITGNGCESTAPCPTVAFDAGPPPPLHLVTTLSGMPHGISACGGAVYYFDDATLMTTTGQKLVTLPATPAGGIACDGGNLYFATLSSGDAGPDGVVYRYHPGDAAPTPVASGVDPGRGVDARGDGVYWISRSEAADAGPVLTFTGDAGSRALVPAVETTTYKSFALLDDADYAISGNSVWGNPRDGGAPFTLPFDATNARALLRANGPLPIAVVTLDAGDGIVITDDASTPIAQTPRVVATASDATHAIFATDGAVYEWAFNGSVTLLSSPYLHITDVTLDATNAYWVTRGAAATPGAVWQAGL